MISCTVKYEKRNASTEKFTVCFIMTESPATYQSRILLLFVDLLWSPPANLSNRDHIGTDMGCSVYCKSVTKLRKSGGGGWGVVC